MGNSLERGPALNSGIAGWLGKPGRAEAVLVSAILCGPAVQIRAATPAKPNIVLILADDLGAMEPGCYGNAFNETPNLDRMAAEGIRFTRAYSPAPVCSPTRASLMTGQNPARHGITDFLDNGEDIFLDPAKVAALPKVLKEAGYRTGIIGKWHLDEDYRSDMGSPGWHGFDESILVQTGYVGGGDYRYPYRHIAGVSQRILPAEDLTARMNLEALDFISRNKGAPFLLYLSHYSVHTTLDAPDSMVAYFNGKRGAPGNAASNARNPVLAAMLKVIDNGVGGIEARLKDLGLDSNTLVVFTSDNGGDGQVTDNGTLRGGKGMVYEGGIRVPMVARWPGVVPAGRTAGRPVVLTDLFPTFAALAGAALPAGQPVDGVDLFPLLRGTGDLAPRNLVWHYPQVPGNHFNRPSAAALLDPQGRKVIRFYDTDSLQLFDLAKDGSEADDLAGRQPEAAAALAGGLKAFVDSCLHGREFRDDFEDGDADGWTTFGGPWSAASKAYAVGAGEGFKALAETRFYFNVSYQVRVVAGVTGNAGLLFRTGAAGIGRFAYRGYYAYVSAATGRVEISKVVDGVPTTLGQKDLEITAGKAHLLRVVARGPRLEVFVDDTTSAAITLVDSTFDGGLLGLRAHNGAASFDDLQAIGLRPERVPVTLAPGLKVRPGTAPVGGRSKGTLWFRGPASGREAAAGRFNVRGEESRESQR